MADHADVELVRRAFDAYDRHDIFTLAQLIATDVVMHVSGRHKLSGDHRGRPQVMQLLDNLRHGTAATLVHTPETFFVGGENVAVVVRATARRLGYSLDVRQCWVWRIQEGTVVEVTVLSEDEFVENAFWQ